MERKPLRARWRPIKIVFIFGLFMAMPPYCISERAFECELTLAHVVECCPNYDAEQHDCFEGPGCYGPEDPFLHKETASCIKNTSCAQLETSFECNIESIPCVVRFSQPSP